MKADAPRLRVAYVVSVVPDAVPAFTADEVGALDGPVEILPCGLIGRRRVDGWSVAPSLASPALWRAVLAQSSRHPRRLANVLFDLARATGPRPKQLLIAGRATISALYLAHGAVPDLIHAEFAGPAAVAALIWSRLVDRPYTVRAHAYDIYMPYAWAPMVLRSARLVMPISEHGRAHIRASWGIDGEVVHVGIPIDRIPRRAFARPGTPLRAMSAARLVPKKGIDVVVEAVHLATRIGHPVSLDIYGDGPSRPTLEAATTAGPAKIRFHGAVPSAELRAALAGHDVFVLPCRVAADGDTDGIPVVLMEAMAAGIPVVSSPTAGIPELITHRRTGALVESTPQAVAEELRRMSVDFDGALAMAVSARSRVEEGFDIVRTSAHLVAAWRRVALMSRA